MHEEVARKLLEEGLALGRRGQHEAAVAVFADVVARFGDATEPAVRGESPSCTANTAATRKS